MQKAGFLLTWLNHIIHAGNHSLKYCCCIEISEISLDVVLVAQSLCSINVYVLYCLILSFCEIDLQRGFLQLPQAQHQGPVI